MDDWIGSVLVGITTIATAAVILAEFIRGFRAGRISPTGAGRISLATGLLIIAAAPVAYSGLDGTELSAISWFGIALVGLGMLLEMRDSGKNSREDP